MQRSSPQCATFGLRCCLAACVLLALALSPSAVQADDVKVAVTNAPVVPPPPPPPKWESDATIGVTLTRGNSKTFLASGAINSKRKWDKNEILLGASAGYGDNTTVVGGAETKTVTDNYVKGFGQYNYLFTERLYGGLRIAGEHDEIADVDYRFTFSPLLGYYFIKQTNAFLAGEVGPSAVVEKQGGIEKTYLAARVAERGEYKFANGARIWESVEWVPQVDNIDNWVATMEVGVSAPLAKSLDIKLLIQDVYDNQPAAGRERNDLKLIAGIGYRW
jgi:hypothetical protein